MLSWNRGPEYSYHSQTPRRDRCWDSGLERVLRKAQAAEGDMWSLVEERHCPVRTQEREPEKETAKLYFILLYLCHHSQTNQKPY